MNTHDNEPGPCKYWAYQLDPTLSILITLHLHFPGGASGTITATEPDIERIINALNITDAVSWRLDRDCRDFFETRYPSWSK